jgi:hypothetical protein
MGASSDGTMPKIAVELELPMDNVMQRLFSRSVDETTTMRKSPDGKT